MRNETGKCRRTAVLVAALGLTSCASTRLPLNHDLTWFGYLRGDDVRTSCVAGSPDRFRVVFNAPGDDHVRFYEVVADGHGGASIEIQVLDARTLSAIALGDPVKAWSGIAAMLKLTPSGFAALTSGLAASGAFSGQNPGIDPGPGRFGWLVAGCHEGRWFFGTYADSVEGFVKTLGPSPPRPAFIRKSPHDYCALHKSSVDAWRTAG